MNPRGAATLRLPSSSLPRDPLFQVSVLGCPDPAVHEIAYQYGKNVGIDTIGQSTELAVRGS